MSEPLLAKATAPTVDSADDDFIGEDAEVELAPSAMRARSRVGPILVYFAWELVVGLVIATPLHGLVRATIGGHPAGDSGLFEPGGRMLVSVFGGSGAALAVTTRTTLALLVVGLVAMHLPLGALLASFVTGLGPRQRSPRQVSSFRHATSAFAPLMAISVVSAALQGAWVFAAFSAGAAVTNALAPRIEDLRAFLAGAAVTCVLVLLAALLTPLVDIARASVVRGVVTARTERTTASLLAASARTVVRFPRREKLQAIIAWAARTLVGIGLVAGAASITTAVTLTGARWVTATWLLHQGVVLARTALRASWLARASRAVATQRASER